MEPRTADPFFNQIGRQIFRQAFCQRRDQRPFALRRPQFDLFHQVLHLATGRMNRDRRIDESRRTNQLLDNLAARLFDFPIGGRGRDEHRLFSASVPFFEFEWPVVERHRQSEPVFDECRFARMVAIEHRPDLRDTDM